VRISTSVVSINDLVPAFAGIRRSHRANEKLALVPWICAYLLAQACEGRLPKEAEVRELPYHDAIQSVILRESELPDDADADMLVATRLEWLAREAQKTDPMGRDFRGDSPEFRYWQVAYASWIRPEARDTDAFLDVPLMTSAWPSRLRLAAFRIAFDI
jgi:hypothetical protein